MSTKVAVVQKPPVLLDRDKTIAGTLQSIIEAVGEGASLIVFPEAHFAGYPTWIWRLKPGEDMTLSSEIHPRLRQNPIESSGNDLAPLQEATSKNFLTIVLEA